MCNNSLEIGLDFEDRMNELATQFAQAADGAPYVVYAILDSTKTDPRSRYQALPFYVGETKNPHGRAIDHIRRALAQRDKYQSARSEIYHLILANQLPRTMFDARSKPGGGIALVAATPEVGLLSVQLPPRPVAHHQQAPL